MRLLTRLSCVGRSCRNRNLLCRNEFRLFDCGDVAQCSTAVVKKGDVGTSFFVSHLRNKSLIRITGVDTVPFLHGLVTNDMYLFDHPERNSVYALMLNKEGRVLYDLLIYRVQEALVSKRAVRKAENDFLIEIDSRCLNDFGKLLLKYKMRKNVDMVNCDGELKVYACYSPADPSSFSPKPSSTDISTAADVDLLHSNVVTRVTDMAFCVDPRVDLLGSRFICLVGFPITNCFSETIRETDEETYRQLRYSLGVPEGMSEIQSAKALPLEYNGDYMKGISFHKGCYIGQELTARVHHTGVVRKRVVPLYLQSDSELRDFASVPRGSPLTTLMDENTSVGKFIAASGRFGLGLVRIDQVFGQSLSPTRRTASLDLVADGNRRLRVTAMTPSWWLNGEHLAGHIRGIQSTVAN